MLQRDPDARSAQAENYAHHLAPTLGEIWAADIIQVTKPRPGDVILHVGCGTGVVAFKLAHMVGETGKVVGIEDDPDLLSIARRIKNALGAFNVNLSQGEYPPLPYPNELFDRVICAHEIAFAGNRPAVVREMQRVLTRSGRLILMSTGTRKGNPHEAVLAEAFRHTLGMEPPFFTKLFSLGEFAGMEVLLLEAGLRSSSVVERVYHSANFITFDGFWRAMVEGRSLSQVYEMLNPAQQDAIRSEVFHRMAVFRDGSGYTVPMEDVIGTSIKA